MAQRELRVERAPLPQRPGRARIEAAVVPREAQVGHLGAALAVDQHVVGLEVACRGYTEQ